MNYFSTISDGQQRMSLVLGVNPECIVIYDQYKNEVTDLNMYLRDIQNSGSNVYFVIDNERKQTKSSHHKKRIQEIQPKDTKEKEESKPKLSLKEEENAKSEKDTITSGKEQGKTIKINFIFDESNEKQYPSFTKEFSSNTTFQQIEEMIAEEHKISDELSLSYKENDNFISIFSTNKKISDMETKISQQTKSGSTENTLYVKITKPKKAKLKIKNFVPKMTPQVVDEPIKSDHPIKNEQKITEQTKSKDKDDSKEDAETTVSQSQRPNNYKKAKEDDHDSSDDDSINDQKAKLTFNSTIKPTKKVKLSKFMPTTKPVTNTPSPMDSNECRSTTPIKKNQNSSSPTTIQPKDETEIIEQLQSEITKQKKNFETQLEEMHNQMELMKKEYEKEIRLLKEASKQDLNGVTSSNRNKNKLNILDSSKINELEKLEKIGRGSSAEIYKVAKKEIYALKIMEIESKGVEELQQFFNEYEIMNILDHPNILKTYGIFLSDEKRPPSLLLEYCSMNLERAIKSNTFTKIKVVFTIYQIAEGMKYVHFRKVIHRDLKPANILVGSDGSIKISDFGISKLMTAEEQSMTKGLGTQKFMAPEIINEREYDEKVDVYSFGVIVFFILSGGQMPNIILRDVCLGKKAEIPPSFTNFARDLINACWEFDPKERPSFKKICEDIERNNFNLLKLNKSEFKEVEIMVNNHKYKIPPYSS